MLLVVAATELELEPVRRRLEKIPGLAFLACGVGPVESAVNLTSYLHAKMTPDTRIVHFGVGGAYLDRYVNVLDLCLADREKFGDLGICHGSSIEQLPSELDVKVEFPMDVDLICLASEIFVQQNIECKLGTFVTVNCSSGTTQRGNMLRDCHGAICENMEGAAIARVCREFDAPCLELRCISNMVEDRDPSKWQLHDAITKCAGVVATLCEHLNDSSTL